MHTIHTREKKKGASSDAEAYQLDRGLVKGRGIHQNKAKITHAHMTHTRGEIKRVLGEHGTHRGGGSHHPDLYRQPSATEKDKTNEWGGNK